MKNVIRISILFIYCIPFAFLCAYGDVKWRTMLFYALMALCFTGLSYAAIKTNNKLFVYIGNSLSLASSCIAAGVSGLGQMNHYFKPLTAYSLIFIITAVAVVFQSVPVILSVKKR